MYWRKFREAEDCQILSIDSQVAGQNHMQSETASSLQTS